MCWPRLVFEPTHDSDEFGDGRPPLSAGGNRTALVPAALAEARLGVQASTERERRTRREGTMEQTGAGRSSGELRRRIF